MKCISYLPTWSIVFIDLMFASFDPFIIEDDPELSTCPNSADFESFSFFLPISFLLENDSKLLNKECFETFIFRK